MSTQVEDPKVFGSSFSHFIFVSFFYFLFFYGLIFSSWRLRAEKGKREREREEKRIKWNLMAGAWRGANAIPRPGRMTWWIQDTQRETKKRSGRSSATNWLSNRKPSKAPPSFVCGSCHRRESLRGLDAKGQFTIAAEKKKKKKKTGGIEFLPSLPILIRLLYRRSHPRLHMYLPALNHKK
jgi:hypothetical protein